MNKEFQEYLDFAKGLANEAGTIMRRYFDAEDIGTVGKEDETPLTVADTTINEMVISKVKEAYSDHGILGEEDSFNVDAEYLWVCDPIDGTFPYSHGIPNSTFSLALCKNGSQMVAVLYDPFMDRMAYAARDNGAWLNGKKLELQAEYPNIGHKGLNIEVWTGSGSAMFATPNLRSQVEEALAYQGYIELYFCSVAYSGLLVASGKMTGLTIAGSSAWDLAAIDLIIREAGGVVSDCFGSFEQQDFSKKQTLGLIAARNQAEYDDIASKIIPIYKAAERR